ncbi:SDR family oxidoreductase [Rhodopirellula sallentina]|uniref:3-ketoacyl-(Acyl-carrier-protein) reductase n=1 Tax=Rhodopirellula sallentina SM41 TaxID=1263870 RepID=M5U570_9BACT|nr:SDR family NAD(P)-dependent oxidoreductase [Rhodopirellula sallentina]EMI53006.1 3-ketoacyl-(acyl-carrier-protein) reductase [Rhodopirellula sallentina SM41]
MNIDLSEQVILVTGGSSGIGKGIAVHAAKCGATVAIVSRDEPDMRAVVDAIEADGGTASWAHADVTDSDAVKAAVEKTVQRHGHLDAVVANAGTNGTWAPIDEMTPDEWRKTIDVNLTGTYLTIHHSVAHLRKRGRGSIVIMSSINGTRTFSNEGASAYASSKAGQFALAQMLALELAPSKIRVNVICPGSIQSEIHDKTNRGNLEKIETPIEYPEGDIPLTGGEFGSPEQVANAAAFLMSDLSSHITGTPIWIDGGQSLIV